MNMRATLTCGDRRASEQGVALVAVLWVTVCLVAIVLTFAENMRLENQAGANAVAAVQAGQAVEGARRYLQLVLDTSQDGPGEIPDISEYTPERVQLDEATFWVLGRSDAQDTPTEVNTFGFVDEASKLNLNAPSLTAAMIELLPDMTPELAAAIIDWRDENSEIEPSGAESETYSLKTPPYECKNAPFESVEELRLVHGFTWELLYGEDVNRNGVLDPNENDGDRSYPPDNADGVLKRGYLEYFTIFSQEPNVKEDGSTRVNVATRQNRQSAVSELESLYSGIRDVMAAIGPAEVQSLLEFYMLSRMTPEDFALIEDAITVSQDTTIVGRVNVNTAPVEVLTCVPGLGETFAAQLVQARRGKAADDLKSIAWVREVITDDAAAIKAGPYLTTKAYRLSADVAAVGRNGRGLQRSYFVFDVSGDTSRVIFRSDWSALGWPLGTTLRDELRPSGRNVAKRGMG